LARKNLSSFKNIKYYKFGLYDSKTTLFFDAAGGSSSKISETGSEKIDVDTLDNLGVITISTTAETGETIDNNLVDDFINTGFTTKGDDKKDVADERKNAKLNLIPGSVRHNLAQILVNDYINTLAFNQLLYGDEAKAFKDEIDQVKRAKGANGSGASLESIIINPDLGITEQFTKMQTEVDRLTRLVKRQGSDVNNVISRVNRTQ
jgi:hypothetical protein